MNYSYSKGAAYAKSLGLEWQEKWVENFDQMAAAHGFTQAQIDLAVQHHLVITAHAWHPKIYKFSERLKIAAWFIFGRGFGLKNKDVK